MTHTELKYIAHMMTIGAGAVIEYSDLNVDRISREYHTAHLAQEFVRVLNTYLAENKPYEPTDILNESTGD